MIRLIVVFLGSVGLIVVMAFLASRVLRSRTEGLSIRLQVLLALGLIVGTFAFGLGLMVLDRIEARATLLATEAARDEAAAIAASIASQIDSGASLESIAHALDSERARGASTKLNLSVADKGGRELFRSGAKKDEPGTVVVVSPIETRGGIAGQVQVVKPTIVMRRLLADFAPTVLIISTILVAVAAFAAAIIGRAIASPIERLTEFAVRVSNGERTVMPPAGSGLEVRRLTKAIDKMRRELEGRPYVESFAADLSHELKNPVAAIRAAAEVLDDGALSEPEEAARFVKRIRESVGRIEALLTELLSLARIEARGIENEAEVDLGAIAQRSAETYASRGAIEVHAGEGPLVIRGDERWLARAVDNLVSNALNHGEAGKPVRIEVVAEGGSVVLRVLNSGRIAPHVRRRLFRRFVTTRGDRGGTGLGLAIVRAVAEAHRGAIEAHETDGLVEFRMTLPPG